MLKDRVKKPTLKNKLKELEAEITRLRSNLIHDQLTGLKTRAYFEEEAGKYLDIIAQQKHLEKYATIQRKEKFGFKNLAIIFFDIDHFKNINDRWGHTTGDEVLKGVARAIETSVRTGDTVARWGGEEFIAMLLGASESDAALKAEEIREKISKLKFQKACDAKVTISAGVTSSEISCNLLEMTNRADTAMYRAKGSGRNRVVSYTSFNQ